MRETEISSGALARMCALLDTKRARVLGLLLCVVLYAGLRPVPDGLWRSTYAEPDFKQELAVERVPGVGARDLDGGVRAVRFRGRLAVTRTGEYQFFAQATGAFRVEIDGRRIMDRWGDASDLEGHQLVSVRLKKGYLPIRIDYRPAGEPSILLNWSGEKVPPNSPVNEVHVVAHP